MTIRRHAGSGVAAPSGPRLADGPGLSVRRRPLDPASPIDYASLSPGALVEGVTADRGHAAGYEAGYADGQRDAEAAARDAERDSLARIDRALTALCRSVEAARCGLRGACRPSSRARCPSSPSTCWRRCSDGSRCSPSIPAARPWRGRSLWTRARFRRWPGSLPTMQPRSGTWRTSRLPAPSRWSPIPTVEPGGALVEVGSTTIDSQLSRALDRVRAVIIGQSGEDPR